MDRAYRGRPCSGGGRASLRPADPDVAAGDVHLHHGRRPGARHGALYRATKDGRSRSMAVSRETMRAPEPPNWAASVDLTASSPAIRIWAICAGSRRVGYPIRAQRSAADTLRGDHADLGRYLR